MMRKLLFLVMTFFYVIHANIALSMPTPVAGFESIKNQLKIPEAFSADFKQKKTIQGFKTPLESSGEILIQKGQVILWKTQKPFARELKLTPNEIVEMQNQQVTFKLRAGDEPGMILITSTLFSVITLDQKVLQQNFDMNITRIGSKWLIRLKPKNEHIAVLVRQIDIGGTDHVQSVNIKETSGGDTQIIFSNPKSKTTKELLGK